MKSGTALGLVIKNYSRISIDDYQRTYSWQPDQIDDLFSDLLEASALKENHFFGTLIFQESEDVVGEATIVDGQQRMTTAFLLLASIRDAVMGLSIHEIKRPYPMAPDRPGEVATELLIVGADGPLFRFEGNQFIRRMLIDCVFQPPGDQKEVPERDKALTLPLRKAIRRVRDRLEIEIAKRDSDAARLEFLNDLLETLLERFVVLKIETSNLNESLDVFLTMNDRGLALGPSDIVKGKLMSALGRGLSESAQTEIHRQLNFDWEELVEDVREPETFLRHFLLSTGDSKVQKKKVVGIVEKRLKGSAGQMDTDTAKDFWYDLKNAGRLYRDLVSVNVVNADVQYELTLLEGLQKSHRILLLAYLLEAGTENSETFKEVVHLTFALSYKWAVADKGRQALEDCFHQQAIVLRGPGSEDTDGDVPVEDRITSVITNLTHELADIDVDSQKAFSRNIDGSFVARAVLHYAQKLSASGSLLHQIKEVHLEHIAPQKSTQSWLEMFFEGNSDLFDTYDDRVTSLGNLTLLDPSINEKISNKDFSDKKTSYSESSMYLTTNLKDFDAWTTSIVDSRTQWLAEVFEAITSPGEPPKRVNAFKEWGKSGTLI